MSAERGGSAQDDATGLAYYDTHNTVGRAKRQRPRGSTPQGSSGEPRCTQAAKAGDAAASGSDKAASSSGQLLISRTS